MFGKRYFAHLAIMTFLSTGAIACTSTGKLDTALGLHDANVMNVEYKNRLWRPDSIEFGAWRAELLERAVKFGALGAMAEKQGQRAQRIDARVKRDGKTRAQGRCTELGVINPELEEPDQQVGDLRSFACDVKVSSGQRWRLRLTPSSELRDDFIASLRRDDHSVALDIFRADDQVRLTSSDSDGPSVGYVFYLGDKQVAAIQTKGDPTVWMLRGLDQEVEDALAVTVPLVLHMDEDIDR